MISKKGVSPLIATVLLVGFAIALGAIVSTFLINNAKESFKPDEIVKDTEFCDSVAIGYNYTSTTWDKTGETNIKFLKKLNITNKGSYSIVKITVRPNLQSEQTSDILDYTASENQDKPIPLEGGIKPGSSAEVRFTYNSEGDGTVEFVPWVKDYTAKDKNKYIICNNKKIKFNLHDVCNKLTPCGW